MNYIKTSSPKAGVALIELNRPEKRNALNNATLQEIATQLQAYDAWGRQKLEEDPAL